jgi:uncharacterized protein involved in type VI secretion and phage assembly
MAGSRPIYGVVVGIVTQNDDKDKLGRVKVKFPWLSDNDESDWARITQLGAGPNAGAVFIPEVNDEVLVAFEHGDISRPFVIGGLYNGKDKPNLGDGLFNQGKVKRNGFVSRKGHKFVFFEDSGKSGIALITSDAKIKVSLNESNSEVHIECQGKVLIKSQGDMNLESGGSLSLKGDRGVKVNSSGTVEVKGQQVKLN